MSDAPALVPPKKVTNPLDAPLRKPPSQAIRWYIVMLQETNREAALGAALGWSWHGPGRPETAQNVRDMSKYGTLVIDELLERDGVTMLDITKAGTRAFVLLAEGLVGEQEVRAAEGNSEAGTASVS
jgi:hypothetical protein